MFKLFNTILFCCAFLLGNAAFAREGSGYTYFQNLTGDDADSNKSHWDQIYRRNQGYVFGKDPAPFLVSNLNKLPVGKALDIAMGEGRNAVFLAQKGFDVTGVDISEVAVRKAKRLAREKDVRIRTVIVDLNTYQIAPESYDVILVFYYLQRSLVPQLIRGLKPGGMIVFEGQTEADLKYRKAQSKDVLLTKGELKELFKGLQEVKYTEVDDGTRAYASLLARKPRNRE